ncbi:hypothetical protein [Kaarinaea lacus]
MRSGHFSVFGNIVILIALSVGLAACESNQPGKAAPIGDHAVLEQLASAYRSVAAEYPVQPSSMRPKGKKEFVERVFTTAGYHYGATLTDFARQGVDVTNQDQRDLADLLFLPHQGLGIEEMDNLYSADELEAIRAIQAGLK